MLIFRRVVYHPCNLAYSWQFSSRENNNNGLLKWWLRQQFEWPGSSWSRISHLTHAYQLLVWTLLSVHYIHCPTHNFAVGHRKHNAVLNKNNELLGVMVLCCARQKFNYFVPWEYTYKKICNGIYVYRFDQKKGNVNDKNRYIWCNYSFVDTLDPR